jgi:hypothetical protein
VRRLLTCLALGAVLGGCIHSDLERVQPGPDDRDPAAAELTQVGESVTTIEGNVVTVRRVEEPVEAPDAQVRLMDVEVEICAADDGDGAASSPAYFRALIPGQGYRRPAAAGKRPALAADRLEAGACARGWIGFPVRPSEDVEAIVLLASSTVEWVLP